ncbi:hypothetical protein VTO42DRAFT_1990 [Malbranchea cinnamomea]
MAPRCALTASLPRALTTAFRNLSLTTRRSFSSLPVVAKDFKLPLWVPPYPYGPRRQFKQADFGLYGGATIQFGNKISQGRNKGKTRRIWKPNVRKEKLYSKSLDKWISVKVTHRVLRTINKVGGLDEYLLGDKPARIKELGMFGWWLRWKVMRSNAMKKRFEEEKKRLGVDGLLTFNAFRRRFTPQQEVQMVLDDLTEESRLRREKQAEELAEKTEKLRAIQQQASEVLSSSEANNDRNKIAELERQLRQTANLGRL